MIAPLDVLVLLNIVMLLSISGIHLYWLLGGKWALDDAIPTDRNGRKLFTPGFGPTLFIAAGLMGFALLNMQQARWIEFNINRTYIAYGIGIIGIIFLLRAIGDFRYVGFTKQHKQSEFARRDSMLYTPLCIFLALSHALIYWMTK